MVNSSKSRTRKNATRSRSAAPAATPKRATSTKRNAATKNSRTAEPATGVIWLSVKQWLLRFGFIALIGGLLYGGNELLRPVIDLPVARVNFTGEMLHSDKDWLVGKVEEHVAAGYWATDLNELQQTLEQEPWVYKAAISRVWPNELSIEVSEQSPIARWGEVSYVNHRGEIFPVGRSESRAHLPWLFGPEDSSPLVMHRFQKMEQSLAEIGLELTGLELDRTGSWLAQVDGKVTLVMTEAQLDKEMARFSKIYRKALRDDFANVDQVDLRYSNGVAVSWQDQIASAELEGQF